MGDTIGDMHKEIEQRDIKIEILENKTGLPEFKGFEEMNKLGLKEILSKQKDDRIMDRLNISPNNHKYIKSKKQSE